MILKRNNIFLISILFLIFSIGCGQQETSPKKEEKKPPTSLVTLNLIINKTIDDLEKEHKNTLSQQKQELREKQESKKSSKNKEKSDSELEKNQKFWKELEEKIKNLHQSWNSYESEEKIEEKKVDFIENDLNNLTQVIPKENIISTLLKINQLNLSVAGLYENYDSKIKKYLEEIKSYTREISYLNFLNKDNKSEQLKNINKIKEVLPQIEFKFEKDEKLKKEVGGLKKAVEDLESAIKENMKEVVQVKSDLILNKVKKLE